MIGLYDRLERALLEPDPVIKTDAVFRLEQNWVQNKLSLESTQGPLDLDDPGRPAHPELVSPRNLPKRSSNTPEGRIILLHAFAHIEFNAINIALDAVYRFRDMPMDYNSDWIKVASDESRHFRLLSNYLETLGSSYGAYPAHNGLWDMVCKTRHDSLHRMALVPRVMEARGLDVTPGMIEKFKQADDSIAVSILQTIYKDEIDHVRIGNCWYQYLCDQQNVDSAETFKRLVKHYLNGKLRGPFNHPARLEAGFDELELEQLEAGFE
jgi:uncharacterized ferritin-like protein (DUF455 family)